MHDVHQALAEELTLPKWQIDNALKLFAEGGTVPFIARYRKEQTGGMDEIRLRSLLERRQYLNEQEERKEATLQSIDEQGRLTEDLRARFEATVRKAELEDLYLPYRPKRRTRGTAARERGLQPLAAWIHTQDEAGTKGVDLEAETSRYVDAEREVATPQDALQGASDVLAEDVAETAAYRAWIRDHLLAHGVFTSSWPFPPGCAPVSQLAYRFVKDPTEVVKVGQVVRVRVTRIDEKLNRIGLSMPFGEARNGSRARPKKREGA